MTEPTPYADLSITDPAEHANTVRRLAGALQVLVNPQWTESPSPAILRQLQSAILYHLTRVGTGLAGQTPIEVEVTPDTDLADDTRWQQMNPDPDSLPTGETVRVGVDLTTHQVLGWRTDRAHGVRFNGNPTLQEVLDAVASTAEPIPGGSGG